MSFPVWQGAQKCSEGPQPGVQAFVQWVIEQYGDEGAFNLGIYNCRTIRGGSTTSLHGEGRACDIGFPVGDPEADELLRRLLRVPGRLGIQVIIYERMIYSAKSPKGRPYTGVHPHNDHLHIEFTWEAARSLTYTTVKTVLARKRRQPGTRDLQEGCRGADVRWLQEQLDIEPVDGIYGPITKSQVKKFEQAQKSKFPRMWADGNVMRITWKALGVKHTY